MRSPDLFEALQASTEEPGVRPPLPRRRRRSPATYVPLVPKRGLTHEQATALIADVRRMEKRAKEALARLEAGGSATGAAALAKLRVEAGDVVRWGETHLEANNPQILDLDPLS